MSTEAQPAKRQRPLSPHLQVYRPQFTSITSITHRITGIVLSLGLVLIVLWLAAAATGGRTYQFVQGILMTTPAVMLMMGWSLALFYHLGNGIRHLFWDMGKGLNLTAARNSAIAVILFAFAATVLAWWMAIEKLGGWYGPLF